MEVLNDFFLGWADFSVRYTIKEWFAYGLVFNALSIGVVNHFILPMESFWILSGTVHVCIMH